MNLKLSTRVLPTVALLTNLISHQGICGLDTMDMNVKKSEWTSKEGGTIRGLKKSKKVKHENFSRIIGGTPVEAGEYPWFARATLSFFGIEVWYGCGGSLVAEEMVLTAAHCGFSSNGVGLQIGALCPPYGPSASQNCGQEVEEFNVVEVYNHPGYDAFSSDKDFAILKMSGKSTIDPVPMDTTGVSEGYADGKLLTPIGFGTTVSGDSSSSSDILLDVNSPYVNNDECDDMYGFFGPITPAMMCAGDTNNGGEDACQGDSGGPLYDKDGDLLVGVTSWGIGCGLANYPGVYARVSNQWDAWIKPTICDNHSNPKPCYCDDSCTDGDDNVSPPTDDGVGTDDSTSECPSGQKLLEMELNTDQYGYETSMVVVKTESNGGSTAVEIYGSKANDPYGNSQTYNEELCLDNDVCYKFVMFDDYGDGLCCGYGNGSYEVTYGGDVIVSSNFEGGEREITEFGDC